MADRHGMQASDLTPSVFGELFIKNRNKFTAIALSYVRNQAVAEDIVSESFTSFWYRREEIELKTCPESYILRSVRNKCLNYLRDNSRMILAEGSVDPDVNLRIKTMLSEISILETGEMDAVYSAEVKEIFLKFLSSSPELSQNIFLSSRFEDLTYEEIARKYGVTPRKVKREIQKSLEILRVSLKDYLPVLLLICMR
jgi:RNA polymerase sigma-70 factor, ECF subfamily